MNHIFILTLAVFILFYAIYFAKMLVQRAHGIQTRQLRKGAGKRKETRTVEMALSFATLAIVPAQLFSMIRDWSLLPNGMRILGIIAGLLGDFVFLVAVVTMRDSWRAGVPSEDEKTALVSDGIYQYSRNPAFLGFDLMYIGILLAYCNPVLLVFTLLAVITLHLQILQEEKYLSGVFGEDYAMYKRRTSRYLGRKNGG